MQNQAEQRRGVTEGVVHQSMAMLASRNLTDSGSLGRVGDSPAQERLRGEQWRDGAHMNMVDLEQSRRMTTLTEEKRMTQD